jgi:hypothetical protein
VELEMGRVLRKYWEGVGGGGVSGVDAMIDCFHDVESLGFLD